MGHRRRRDLRLPCPLPGFRRKRAPRPKAFEKYPGGLRGRPAHVEQWDRIMSFLREADAEPIPGYRLIEPLGSGGVRRGLKYRAPGGLVKALKILLRHPQPPPRGRARPP